MIEATILEERPTLVVVDSIQTLYSPELSGAPGGVGQVRECAAPDARGQERGIAVMLVGHVTKRALSRGRASSSTWWTLCSSSRDRFQNRILRALKNRFGSTNEVGVFEMSGTGMVEVADPSAFFLSKREKRFRLGW